MAADTSLVRLGLSVPVWVKERIVEAAAVEGVSVSHFCAAVLCEAAGDTIGFPAPPPAVAPVPSLSDVLRSYVEGSARLIGPCGDVWPCEYSPEDSRWIGDCEFCGHCSIRVK